MPTIVQSHLSVALLFALASIAASLLTVNCLAYFPFFFTASFMDALLVVLLFCWPVDALTVDDGELALLQLHLRTRKILLPFSDKLHACPLGVSPACFAARTSPLNDFEFAVKHTSAYKLFKRDRIDIVSCWVPTDLLRRLYIRGSVAAASRA